MTIAAAIDAAETRSSRLADGERDAKARAVDVPARAIVLRTIDATPMNLIIGEARTFPAAMSGMPTIAPIATH